jgi:2-polyprenyl-6-methoxyphenol hydroxylase and related FAD-dependent oxidoreductases
MTIKKHVVVIGAGPTGLLTAYGLAKQGVHVTVVEERAMLDDSPRAMVYLPSSLKALDDLGLLEEAEKVGARGHAFTMRFASGYIGELDHRVLQVHTPYYYTLHFGQHVLAKLILEQLLKLPNASVLWGTRFNRVVDNAQRVAVEVSTEAGEQRLEADWVVAADGARSAVRKSLGIKFEGFTWPDTFMATNVYFDFAAHGYCENTMIADPVNWAVISKISNDNLWRVAYGERTDWTEEERQANVAKRYEHFLPEGASYTLDRASSYRVHQRCASTYRAGRILLAGDAAHATSPIGGLGFTAGIQDAVTLIEALGLVLKGHDEDVLDYYAAERRRIFLDIVNPLAIEHKRRVQEADPGRRAQDEEGFRKMASDPNYVRNALMNLFALVSTPYSADWRDRLGEQDTREPHAMPLFTATDD